MDSVGKQTEYILDVRASNIHHAETHIIQFFICCGLLH